MHKSKEKNLKSLERALKHEAKSTGTEKRPLNFTPKVELTAEEMRLYDHAVFTWTAPEYIQHPKGKMWYLIAGCIAAFAVVVDVLTANWSMALAVVVLAIVYGYIHLNHPPKNIKITVSKMGIKVGNMIFPYSHIQAFWIHYNPPLSTTLNLRAKGHFFSDVIIELNHEDPVPLRHFLCGQIPEWEGKNERVSDVLLKLLKL